MRTCTPSGCALASARSSLPSPFQSPTATARGCPARPASPPATRKGPAGPAEGPDAADRTGRSAAARRALTALTLHDLDLGRLRIDVAGVVDEREGDRDEGLLAGLGERVEEAEADLHGAVGLEPVAGGPDLEAERLREAGGRRDDDASRRLLEVRADGPDRDRDPRALGEGQREGGRELVAGIAGRRRRGVGGVGDDRDRRGGRGARRRGGGGRGV